ncbi:MAG: PEP-CTERM sorting domain-containing protein [Phycisphaerae bacterium]
MMSVETGNSIPEPTALAVLAFGAVAFIRKRR